MQSLQSWVRDTGQNLAAIATMSAIDEFTAAVNAVHENTSLPIFACMTFNDTGKTYTGFSVEDFAKAVNDLPVASRRRKLFPVAKRDVSHRLPSVTASQKAHDSKARMPAFPTASLVNTPSALRSLPVRWNRTGILKT